MAFLRNYRLSAGRCFVWGLACTPGYIVAGVFLESRELLCLPGGKGKVVATASVFFTSKLRLESSKPF